MIPSSSETSEDPLLLRVGPRDCLPSGECRRCAVYTVDSLPGTPSVVWGKSSPSYHCMGVRKMQDSSRRTVCPACASIQTTRGPVHSATLIIKRGRCSCQRPVPTQGSPTFSPKRWLLHFVAGHDFVQGVAVRYQPIWYLSRATLCSGARLLSR